MLSGCGLRLWLEPRGVVAEKDGECLRLVIILGAPQIWHRVNVIAEMPSHVCGQPTLGGEQAAEGAASKVLVVVVLGQMRKSFVGVLLLFKLYVSQAFRALEKLA